MIVIMTAVALLVLGMIVLPFFVGGETQLVACAAINDHDKLSIWREEIIKRYLADEDAWQAGQLSAGAWHKRRIFLTNRYVDVCRRLDYLATLNDAS